MGRGGGRDSSKGGVVQEGWQMRSAAGISLCWHTPIVQLRFNFSRPLIKESYDRVQNFDLTLSRRF